MEWLDQHIPFEESTDFLQFLAQVPGRGAVYLLSDAEGRPFQLLSVKNLRASLANRLCEHPADERTRSIPYRNVVRGVSYRRVDSVAEADWIYSRCAAQLFPSAYAKLIDSWSAWYIFIDPEARFPRYQITDHPQWELSRTTFGPIPGRAAAQKLVETLEDAFDLCRYHHILVQAPHGQACAYKQMHKCPAPCDGSISMGMYRHQIEASIAALTNQPQVILEQEERMRSAATALRFEAAGKIKAYVEQLRSFTTGQFEHVRPISGLRFVAVLRGSRAKTWKLLLLTPEAVELTEEFGAVDEARARLEGFAAGIEEIRRWDDDAFARLTFISRQLMLKAPDAVFVRPDIDQVQRAAAQLSRRKPALETEDEGVLQDAQA